MRTAAMAGTFSAALAMGAAAARAQTAPDAVDPRGADTREELTITGVRQPYRGDFALAEIPQAIAVIDAATLAENNILRLTDALDLNASIARQNTLGGLWDSFAVRGFAGDENLPSGYLVNGFNAGRGFAGQRDVAGIERVEVLKGPSAALFGRGEPGGTINLVTKQAQIGRTFGSVSLQGGSFDRVRVDGDANVALTPGLTARLIGYAESGDTFRDTVAQRRWGLLPSVGLALGVRTRVTYDLEWTRVEVPFDRGIVVLNGDFDTVPRARFLGEPGDGDTVARATGHQLRVQHDLGDGWSLLVGASRRDTLLTGFSSDAETVASRQKLFVDGRSLSRQRRSRDYDSAQTVVRAEIAGDLATGALRHRVLFGIDHDAFRYDQLFTRFRPPLVSTRPSDRAGYVIDIIDPVYGRFPLPATAVTTDRVDRQRATGGYVQDQIGLTDRLQLRLGGRYDDFRLRTRNRLTGVDSARRRGRFSPQAGVVYRAADALTLYGAYGEGYRANVGTDVAGVIFDPETTTSVEAGIKLTALGGRLTGTLAAYQLTKASVLASDANNPGFSVAIGRARSRGIELDLGGRLPGGVDLLLSYAYTDAEARSSVRDPNFSFQIRPGDPLINIPDHSLNVQLARDLRIGDARGRLGAGVQHVSRRSGETGTGFTLPAYTLARVFGEAQLTDDVQLFASVANLFDARWFANSYAPVWVQPGTPRTASLGLRAAF